MRLLAKFSLIVKLPWASSLLNYWFLLAFAAPFLEKPSSWISFLFLSFCSQDNFPLVPNKPLRDYFCLRLPHTYQRIAVSVIKGLIKRISRAGETLRRTPAGFVLCSVVDKEWKEFWCRPSDCHWSFLSLSNNKGTKCCFFASLSGPLFLFYCTPALHSRTSDKLIQTLAIPLFFISWSPRRFKVLFTCRESSCG